MLWQSIVLFHVTCTNFFVWRRQLAAGRSLKFASCWGAWGERSCPWSRYGDSLRGMWIEHSSFQLRGGHSFTELPPPFANSFIFDLHFYRSSSPLRRVVWLWRKDCRRLIIQERGGVFYSQRHVSLIKMVFDYMVHCEMICNAQKYLKLRNWTQIILL